MGKLTITGKALREYPYDLMEISVTFNAQSDSTTIALNTVLNQCEKFLAQVKADGISMQDIRIGEDNTKRNVGYNDHKIFYTAEREVILRVPFSMDFSNYIMSTVRDNGYDASVDIEYLLSNLQEIHNELIKEALADSRKKAEFIAQAMGQKLAGIDSVQISDEREIMDKAVTYECERGITACNSLEHSGELSSPITEEFESVGVVWIIE